MCLLNIRNLKMPKKTSDREVQRLSLELSSRSMKTLEKVVAEGDYSSKSEAIRKAIILLHYVLKAEGEIEIVYKNGVREKVKFLI